MATIFIVGGAGNIARMLAQKLSQAGHSVRSMYRKTEQEEELKALGSTPVQGDLTTLTTDTFAELLKDSDVVIFSAGSGGKGGPEMTRAIDGDGFSLTLAATQKAGIKRLMLVSAFPEAGRGRDLPATFENYMKIKKAADVELASSELDWVILRPGTLTDAPATGKINAGLAISYGDITREDVANTLAELVEKPELKHIIIELTQGDQSVSEALSRLV